MKKKIVLLVSTILIVLATVFLVFYKINNEPKKPKPWYYEDMGFSCLEKYSYKKMAKVAFLDTGLNYELIPYMKNEIVDGYNCIQDNEDFNDLNGHGTSVISLACFDSDTFDYHGVNPNIIVVPVVVADAGGRTTEEYLVKGIAYAISKNVDVINISLGSQKESVKVNQSIELAHKANIIVNCSTGDRCSDTITFPASSEYTFAISAQSLLGCKYINANFNEQCILIPGEKISVIKYNMYDNLFDVSNENGSSYSCSIFTGIVAALVSIKGDEVKENINAYFKKYQGIENEFLDIKKVLD